MGKQKQHRRKLHKENPTGLQSVQEFDKELDEELGEGDREKILQNVYNDVSSEFYRVLCNMHKINYTLFNKMKAYSTMCFLFLATYFFFLSKFVQLLSLAT